MRVDTSGMKVVDGLFGARLCLLAVCVLVCSIDRSNSTDTGAKDTIEDPVRHSQSSLTVAQRDSAYTIEFDFRHIDKKNRTAMNIAYRDARRKIIDRLNSRKRNASSPTTSTTVAADTTIVATTITTTAETTAAVTTAAVTTAAVTTAAVTTAAVTTAADTTTATPIATSTITTLAETTATTTNPTTIVTTIPMEPTTTTAALETTQTTLAVEITTETPTTVSATTVNNDPPPNRRRRKRQQNSEGNNSTLLTDDDDDLLFIDNGLEIDEDGVLRISFFLNTTEFSEDELLKALNELETEENGFKEIAPVIDIYKGLPPVKAAMADVRVWLPILFVIIVLIIIFIIGYCCWKATNKKAKDVEQQKIVPKQDSKPTPSNGHAHPRILDDNSGWLVPYEQFGSEQKM